MTDMIVESFNPEDIADEICDLFARNGQAEFASVFDRAYRARSEEGLRSWIARVDGRVVMHVSVAPMRFHSGEHSIRGGVLGDLMVDEAHRDFWGPVRLVRTMVGALKREGAMRFLFTTATKEAETVFKAGGFKPFGQLRRYVIPTFAPYLAFRRMLALLPRRVRRYVPLSDPMDSVFPSLGSPPYWRPEITATYIGTRIPRSGYADGTWVTLTDRRGEEIGRALSSRHAVLREATLADAFWMPDSGGLPEVALAAAGHARSRGLRTLSVTILDGSAVARDLKKAGFFPRPPFGELLMNSLHEQPAPANDWLLTGFVLSGW